MARKGLEKELVDALIGCYADRLDKKVTSSALGLATSSFYSNNLMSTWEWGLVKRALKLESNDQVLEYIVKHPAVVHLTRFYPRAKLVIVDESTYPSLRFQQPAGYP